MNLLSKKQQDEVLTKNYDYIAKMAVKFWNNHRRMDKDDFIQEAFICAMKHVESYDPNLSEFTTFIHRRIKFHLTDYVRSQLGRGIKNKSQMDADYCNQKIVLQEENDVEGAVIEKELWDLLEPFPFLKRVTMGKTLDEIATEE